MSTTPAYDVGPSVGAVTEEGRAPAREPRDEPPARSTPEDPPSEPSEPTAPEQPRSRPSGESGLSATGGTLLNLVVTLVGGMVDAVVTNSFGWIFGLSFFASAAFVALRIRYADLLAAVIVPPITFAVVIIVAGQFLPSSGGSWLRRQALDLASTLALGAPVLLSTTATAGAVIAFRWLRARHRVGTDAA